MGPNPHELDITVYDSKGNIRYGPEHVVSGGAQGTSWPQQIASHTESKSIIDPRIQPGDHIVYSNATKPARPAVRGI